MPARDRVHDKAPKFQGQKSALPIESYGMDSAEQIKNFYLHHGQLNKSRGSELFAEFSPTESGGILSLHQFKDILMTQRGSTVAWYPILPDAFTGATPTDIYSLTSSKRLQSCFWRDRLFLTNTQDCFFSTYGDSNGVSVTLGAVPLIGLDPPSTAMGAGWFSSGGAGNLANGTYYYMVALYDANTNTESPCSGALPAADGVYELSPNAFLGPRPTSYTVGGGPLAVVISGASLASYLYTAYMASGQRATHFIVYRGTKTSGLYNSFYRVPLKDSGTYDGSVLIPLSAIGVGGSIPTVVNFVDNTANSGLPAVSPPENNSPPPTPARLKAALTVAQASYGAVEDWGLSDYSGFRHMRFFRDQLFGIGAHSYGFTITTEVSLGVDLNQKISGKVANFRDLLHGSEVYQPDYWPYRWEVGRGDGQEAIGLGVLGDVALLIFKESSTYYLSGSSPDNFVVRIMDTGRGAINEGTIQETPKGVITLDRSGFVLWNKIGQGQPLSDNIHDLIEDIDFTYASLFYSCYDTKLKLYRCSVVVAGSQTPNLTFVLDLDTMEWSTEQGGEGLSRLQLSLGSNNLTSRAYDAGATTVQVDSGYVYDFVGNRLDGKVLDYSKDSNVTNNGTAIEGIWTSGTINFGDDQHKKRMNWIYLRAKSLSGWKINVEVIPDYDESRKYVIEDWDVISSQSQWYSSDVATDGTLLWDDGTGEVGGRWASEGQTRQVSKIPVKCIGYTFQIRIIHKETDATRCSFAIESISAEGCQLGR